MTVGQSAVNMANAVLNVFRGGGNGVTFTAPAAITLQLHTGDPGASGTANVSVGDATKVAITHAAASAGSMAISGTAPVFTNAGTSETITHVSYWNSATFLQSAALSSSKAWASGDTYTHSTDTWSTTPIAA
jgi:hypothetical protein